MPKFDLFPVDLSLVLPLTP
uniref:Uncharacterized protein n=1 Tax=Rhizophora mucronata TaxID=61149 RepID=A0A2P2KYJ8_RHIMU